MGVFLVAKNNMLVHFKARFYPDPNGEGYLFYPKERDQGYACSETEYQNFTADFQKFLKGLTRIMWLWFLLGMPIIIGLAVWQNYELNAVAKICVVMLPLPFLGYKGFKLYNAPNILVQGKRPTGRRKTQEQVLDTRIKGMSWLMLLILLVAPILAGYNFLNDASLKDWELSLAISFFMAASFFGGYLMIRKWRIYTKEKKRP